MGPSTGEARDEPTAVRPIPAGAPSKTLIRSPESALFPDMSTEQLQALCNDIQTNGQREAILTRAGAIVDGWHRYLCCIRLGIVPLTREMSAHEDAVTTAVSLNLQRRHLTTSQKALIAARLTLRGNALVVPRAAELFAVSERSVRSARKVVECGHAEVEKQLLNGRLAVYVAARLASEPNAKLRAQMLARALNEDNLAVLRRQRTNAIRCLTAPSGSATVRKQPNATVAQAAIERQLDEFQRSARNLVRALQVADCIPNIQLDDCRVRAARLTNWLSSTLGGDGVSASSASHVVEQVANSSDDAGPHSQRELSQLREALAKVTKERDLLKQAATYFATGSV